jgi:hypothetical protein
MRPERNGSSASRAATLKGPSRLRSGRRGAGTELADPAKPEGKLKRCMIDPWERRRVLARVTRPRRSPRPSPQCVSTGRRVLTRAPNPFRSEACHGGRTPPYTLQLVGSVGNRWEP